MVIEIIVIILSFLIPAYCIYRFSGEEQQDIIVNNQDDDNNNILNNSNNNNINNGSNTDFFNILNNNNSNNDVNIENPKLQQIKNIIIIKKNNNKIDWGNIISAAQSIYESLTDEIRGAVTEPFENIKNILKKEKSKMCEEAVRKWVNKENKENIKNEDIDTIASMFCTSNENIYTFKNIDNDKEEKKNLLTFEEAKSFLNKIKDEEEKKLLEKMSDGEVLQKQEKEMKELEKIQEEKEQKEEKEKIKEEKKLKDIEDKAKEAKKLVVDEPEAENPEATTICFRYPDGGKTKNRRFLKSHKIQNLYDYITSLENEIYSEEGHNGFSLYQPFPPKKYEQMENTLEQEELFPNAVVQIREE